MKTHFLNPGNLIICDEETVVSTLLGSCVSVVLFDPETRLGGINHYLFPEPTPFDVISPRYGTVAIAELITGFSRKGINLKTIRAKIYGGANVLVGPPVGASNIAVAEKILSHLRIPIIEKDIAGGKSRTVKFNSSTSIVTVKYSDANAAPK